MSRRSVISVTLRKREIDGLGLRFRQRRSRPVLGILGTAKDGAAYESGVVRAGDIVLKVNSTDLSNLPYTECLHALRAIKVGENATLLLLKISEEYGARRESAFNQMGKVKTGRNADWFTGNNWNYMMLENKANGRSYSHLSAGGLAVTRKPLPPISRKSDATILTTPRYYTKYSSTPANEPSDGLIFPSTNQNSALEKPNGHEAAEMERSAHTTMVARQLDMREEQIVNKSSEQKSAAPSTQKPVPAFHSLKNWESGMRQNDILFAKKRGTTGCKEHKCVGSVMTPDFMSTDPRKDVRTKEEKIELATDFIKQYYESLKNKNPEVEKKRHKEVVQSIEKTGTFVLTLQELTFGAKTAWRNAPRCIGRIHWNTLETFDCRHVKSTAEMFDAICRHLKYATNNGNLKSCITFFPQRTDDYKKDFRVWSSQFLRYAGYRQADGSVVGDPINVELTDLCIKLGWKPKGGRFDVLPIILQAYGEDPEIYEFPEDLVLEVKLRHPKFEWFEKLGYKWFALPGVSNMLLDIGGVEFCAAPFSGWFMGSEVARDLCDAARYNVLEEVALKMNLDTKNLSSLWKDKAFVEFNIAVVHSFQSDGVSVMDHHSASQSFMKHFANEMKVRGGCPGDWVWLTPPISGSLTPVFHQEILNYSLNPSCQYQPNPWNYHEWKDERLKKKKTIPFKVLVRSILGLLSLMEKAMSHRVKATILYATETGTSLEYAKSLGAVFNRVFSTKVICMEDYDVKKLERESLLIIVASTFGNGDAPENGASFARDLAHLSKSEEEDDIKVATSIHNGGQQSQRFQTKASPAEATGFLPNLRFSVFGLGSTAYPHFCSFAHDLDTSLGKLKGERLLEIGRGDELHGQEEEFRTWAKKIFETACKRFDVGKDVLLDATSVSFMGPDRSWAPNKFRITTDLGGSKEPKFVEGLSKFHRKQISVCTMRKRSNLQSGEDSRSTIFVELDSSYAKKITYQPGDHIGIFPCNQKELVDRVLARLDNSTAEDKPVQLQICLQQAKPHGADSDWAPDEKLPICTLRNAFERYLDITTCPSPHMLKYFADCAANKNEKARLLELSAGKQEYEDWKLQHVPNLPEILEEFPSVVVEASLLLSQLQPLHCRYYSISSSPSVHPGKVHCTVAVVTYKTQGGAGPVHHGVCSTYLDRVENGTEIHAFIRNAVDFRLPPNPTDPILLVGPGTGIAPFRSFWQQRMYEIKQGRKCGEMAFLFGCRHPDRDQLYKDEIADAKACSAITRYEIAFSRLPGTEKQYVQHVLKNKLADLAYDWLMQRKGHLYVCGDVSMADGVKTALIEVLQQKANISKKAAEHYVSKMKEQHRFHEDIFGVTLRTNEAKKSVQH